MKRCPKCRLDYFDQMLEFCLEDGAKLVTITERSTAAKTEVLNTAQNSVETVFTNNFAELPQTVQANDLMKTEASAANETKADSLKRKAVEKGYRTLELGSLIAALAHNWWQWLYVDRQNYGSVSAFLFSADFVIWFTLLLAGTVAGLLTLKYSRHKTFAYFGLVVLAINFILLIVPRK